MKTLLLIWEDTEYILQGLKKTFFNAISIRIEFVVSVAFIRPALLLYLSSIGRIFLIGSFNLLLIIEFLNTTFESAFNRINSEKQMMQKVLRF